MATRKRAPRARRVPKEMPLSREDRQFCRKLAQIAPDAVVRLTQLGMSRSAQKMQAFVQEFGWELAEQDARPPKYVRGKGWVNG